MERIENAELGRAVLDVADLDPEHFDMGSWVEAGECGTIACLGGWTLIKAGYKHKRMRLGGIDGMWFRAFVSPDGTIVRETGEEAARLLGLSTNQEPGSFTPVWYDFEHGVDRFRKMVEEAEGRS